MKKNAWISFKLTDWIGFLILSSMTLYLLWLTVVEASMSHFLGGVIIGLIILGVLLELLFEGRQLWFMEPKRFDLKSSFINFITIIASALLTYSISHNLQLGPVVAACLVGMLAHLVIPSYEAAAFAGAFVGMSSDLMFLNYSELLIAAGISGIVFFISTNIFEGFGGKAGTIALVGTYLASNSLSRPFIFEPLPELSVAMVIILFSVLSTPITFYLNIGKNLGPIMSASLVGIFGGLLIPALLPQNGELYAIIVICAAFIGMTCQRRCSSYPQLLLAGLIMGIVIIFSTPLLGGAGGKLGTTAFIAILAVTGYKNLLKRK